MGMEEGLFTGAYMLHTHQLFEQNWDILTQLKFTVFSCNSLKLFNSPWNSPWQSAFAEGFAKANSVFIVITLVKIFSRWSFPSKIYIQFIIFNTYFSTKLLFTSKRYHLHVLEKCLYMLQEVRSIIYYIFSSLFISFLFVHVAVEQALLSCRISSYQRNSVTSHF